MFRICTVLLLFAFLSPLIAQRVAINDNGSGPHASAMLDISSTIGGVLIPRMTEAQRIAISSPATGLMIYQTNNGPGFYYYNGTVWTAITGSGWSITGNSGTNPATNFIGTADNQPLRLRINNAWAGEIDRGYGNCAIGDSSGILGSAALLNTSFGHLSLAFNVEGVGNAAFGYAALNKNTGSANTAFGAFSLRRNTAGIENTAVGSSSLLLNTNGDNNTGVGFGTLQGNSNGNRNTAVGSGAMQQMRLDDNTAVGYNALSYDILGTGNTAVGGYAMLYNDGGDYNAALGFYALASNTTGIHNTAVGANSLLSNSLGSENTAIGYNALQNNGVGIRNTVVGDHAFPLATGDYNTGLGQSAGYNTTYGSGNTALGGWSLFNNTQGGENTAVGNEALAYNYYGDFNIGIGAFSGSSSSFDNTVSIGNHGYENGGNNQAFLGNLSTIWNGGNVGWSTYSDARVKTDVREEVVGLDFITRLRPVTYHRDIDIQAQLTGNTFRQDYPNKYDIEQIKFSGFLAQEVEQAAISSGYNFSGITKPRSDNELYTLSYESFVVPLVKAVQEQQVIIEMQERKIRDQQLMIHELQGCTDSVMEENASILTRLKEIETQIPALLKSNNPQ